MANFEFRVGDRVAYVSADLAVPGTLVSKDARDNWRINWDDGLTADDHAFSEHRLLHLVCEKGS
jgi:hypothetical protein